MGEQMDAGALARLLARARLHAVPTVCGGGEADEAFDDRGEAERADDDALEAFLEQCDEQFEKWGDR